MIALVTLIAATGATVYDQVTVPTSSASSTVAGREAAERCRDARRGLAYYRLRYSSWRELRGVATKVSHIQPAGCAHAMWAAKQWREKARTARETYDEIQQAKYRAWLSVAAVVRRLNEGLSGTPMAGQGVVLEKWGREFGVSPYFMAAVAATESSLGHAACSNNRRNVWGLASCVNSWPVPYFDTWDEAVRFYADFLSSRWPGHQTPYSFRGYAACSDCWGRKTSSWMRQLFGVPAVTRYP